MELERITDREARTLLESRGISREAAARMVPEDAGELLHGKAENGAELLLRWAPGKEEANLQGLREALEKGFPGARLVSWPGK